MMPCNRCKSADDLEEHFVSIFSVKVFAMQETNMKQIASKHFLDACFLFGLVFDPDDGGDLFVENVC
jgi:hypothetical protein